MRDDEIYAKTDAGREEIRSRALGLTMAARAILLMVDGQRTVGAMRALIAGSKAPADVLDTLTERGLIEPRAGVAAVIVRPEATAALSAPVPVPAAAPVVEVDPRPIPRAPAVAVATALPDIGASDIDALALADGPLDLMLPTIVGPVDPTAQLADAPLQAGLAEAMADEPVGHDRYEHLYSMMNEVVRDFLAPHRRYFFQLKIERCTTAEDLMELLHDLQTALSKARGDAFASDVIARLRSAVA